jgi:hypothetical protein
MIKQTTNLTYSLFGESMKVDELLKRLENVKIDVNKINERHEIAEYLLRKTSQNDSLPIIYIMTKDKKIYGINSYEELLKSNKISPDNAHVYTLARKVYYPAGYYFPFLADRYLLVYAYLSKQGLEDYLHIIVDPEDIYQAVPATGLKYISVTIRYPANKRVVVEVVGIDIVASNTNLPMLVREHDLDTETEYVIDAKIKDIASQLNSQKLFAGYDFSEARWIANKYYEKHDTSLAEEVEAIKDAYNRIFQPYRIEYDLKTKQPISSNK